MLTVYLIGVAGVGKTTALRHLTQDWKQRMTAEQPFAHRHYDTPHGRAIALGKEAQPFGGTDTLSWTAINHVANLYQAAQQRNIRLIIGEGDRFANDRFLQTAQTHGHLLLYHLQAHPDITAQRRETRAKQHGTKLQNPTWIAGRITKTNRLAQNYPTHPIDATQPPERIAQHIQDGINQWLQSGDHA